MAKKNTDFRASESLLAKLHNAVAEDLIRRVTSGEASAPEIAAAIKFLKDNGIEATLDGTTPVEKLAESLPTFADEEDLTEFNGASVN